LTIEIPREHMQTKEDEIKDFKRYLELAEDKTVITLLEKLVDERLLEYITEYPSVAYTKEMVKLMTYIITYMQVYNLDLDDAEDTLTIKEMCRQFMLKMTSHKRRRAHEIVNGASRQDSTSQVNVSEHRGLKRFLGIKN
jgi:hypothetical protein